MSVLQADALRTPFEDSILTAITQPDGRPETASHFLLKHGRLPHITDEKKPWKYPQWLLYYVQGVEMSPMGNGRWSYYMRTLDAGHLLDEPIPTIHFSHEGRGMMDSPVHKLIDKWLDVLFNETGASSAFRALLDWFSWGLGFLDEEPRISEKANEALYRQVNVAPLIQHPFDYWGDIYADSKGRRQWNSTGFYPTPMTLCKLMARMTMGDPPDKVKILEDGRDSRLETFCDCCVGSGRFPLLASNYTLQLYGMDIDPTCVAMSKINGALYAPWMTWPLPAHILGAPTPPRPPAPLVSPEQEEEAFQRVMFERPGLAAAQTPEAKPARPKLVFKRIDARQGRLF